MLRSGNDFNIVITACSGVYSWGYGRYGQLGLGNYNDQDVPQKVKFFKDKQIKEIKCGDFHVFAITENSKVYSWGNNRYGQLGLGNNYDRYIPQPVEFFKDKQIKEIICGGDHTIAITEIGEVYSWGHNGCGQLGLDHNDNQNVPQLVDFFKDKKIKEIICGYNHTFAIINSSDVYSWGCNIYGQLGLGSQREKDESFFEGHNNDQKVPHQVDFFKDKQIKEIICGSYHTIANTESGKVYSWGYNEVGELGLDHCNNQNIPQRIDFFREHPIFTRISNIKSARSASFKN